RAVQLLGKVTPRRGSIATGFHSVLLLRALLIAHSPVRIGLELLNVTILSNHEPACEKPGWTLGVAHRRDDCVRAFFDPVADVVGVKSRLLRRSSHRFADAWRMRGCGGRARIRIRARARRRAGSRQRLAVLRRPNDCRGWSCHFGLLLLRRLTRQPGSARHLWLFERGSSRAVYEFAIHEKV